MELKAVLLGFLAGEDRTGYELKKAVAEEVGFFYGSPSHGAIYPALHDLEREGLVEATRVVQSGRPNKKIYSITEAGAACLRARLSEAPTEDRFRSDLLLRLFFAGGHSEENILGWISERRAVRRGRLEQLRAAELRAKRSDHPYLLLCLRYEMSFCESDLDWLEGAEHLIGAASSGSVP